MMNIYGKVRKRIDELMSDGTVNRVMGWKRGEFLYDETPFVFTSETGFDDFVLDGFSASNQSKYLIEESKKDGKILALLKPCDTYSFNQLLKEHRINRDGVYIIGIPSDGKLDITKIRDKGAASSEGSASSEGIKGILSFEESGDDVIFKTLYGDKSLKRKEILLERCLSCKGIEHVIADEVIQREAPADFMTDERFNQVEDIEKMTPDERFEFWQSELSKCIRCNSCRNVCPACSCFKCVFDNEKSGIASKVSSDSFEDSLFHIIRAYHVAGRCTDCGECSRVCPQNIPLHLINRKFIKDINELYGEYVAGENIETECPLTDFKQGDSEPSQALNKGGKK